jgi:hypothetical protein
MKFGMNEESVQLRKEKSEIYARRLVRAAFPEVGDKLEQNAYCMRVYQLLKQDLELFFNEMIPPVNESDPCPLCGRSRIKD